MSDMNRRLKRAESKLHIDREPLVVVIRDFHDDAEFDLSDPVAQWRTYPQALEKAPENKGFIVLHEAAEIAACRARARQ